MQPQLFRQFGTLMVLLLTICMVGCTLLMFLPVDSGRDSIYILGSVDIVLLLCLINFYQLSITIDQDSLSFSLGVGLIHKSYPIADIHSCQQVKNSAISGYGIRWLSNGWLYNVSGVGAIELHFNNRTSIVRIGTDRPTEIADIVNKLITK